MSLTVASRQILRANALSELARMVLAFVDGGPQWLEHAIVDPQARYHFADETALVAGVQAGLHVSRPALLPATGLLVSPVKLMTMSLVDLRLLAQAEGGGVGGPSPGRLRDLFRTHQLATAADLAEGTDFLGRIGVGGAPVFQVLDMNDRLALLDLARGAADGRGDAALPRDAAAFAVDQARTPIEFVDYYQVYLERVRAFATVSDPPEARAAIAGEAVDALLPHLLGALDCPSVDGLVAPWEIGAAVTEWLTVGRQIGFARVSDGLRQVVASGAFAHETGADARRIVRDYLARAQALLGSVEFGAGMLGQDGASCVFRLATDAEEAEIVLGPTGIITLGGYRRRPAKPATPSARPRSARSNRRG